MLPNMMKCQFREVEENKMGVGRRENQHSKAPKVCNKYPRVEGIRVEVICAMKFQNLHLAGRNGKMTHFPYHGFSFKFRVKRG